MTNMICSKDKCTGCFACYNICPKKAITMKEDSNGFIYPFVDSKLCVNCGLCIRRCPSLNKCELNYPNTCYAFQRKDCNKLFESTSGGAASVLYENVLKNGGHVYGVKYDKNDGFIFTKVTDFKKLDKIKGSKYVHSYINNIFNEIKNDLEKNIMTLFIGTPCQVAGLKSYLGKEYSNLYLVDIICHGVPSQKYLFSELECNGIDKKNITKISFRGNDGFIFKVFNEEKIIYEKKMTDSMYYQGFMDSFFYRENCYNCKYAGIKRVSDLTIGDFWGLGSDSELYNNRKNGVSVLLPITEKGLYLINNMLSDDILEERSISEAQKGNAQLNEAVKKNKSYYKFKNDFDKYGFAIAYKRNRKMAILKKKLKKIKIVNKIIDFLKKR